MGAFKSAVITLKGQALLAKVIAGEIKLEFTKIAISETELTGDIASKTGIGTIKQSSGVQYITRINEANVKASASFTNVELTEGYYVRTIGLYATDPDEGEICYSISCADESVATADWMPPFNGIGVSTLVVDLVTAVSNSVDVEITIDPTAMATVAQVMDLENSLKEVENRVEHIEYEWEEIPLEELTEHIEENINTAQAIHGISKANLVTVDSTNGNTKAGENALASLTDGNSNTAYGKNTMRYLQKGSYNTIIGKNAGLECGNNLENNVLIGFESGLKLRGNNNVIIGNKAGKGMENNANNNVVIGFECLQTKLSSSANGGSIVAVGYRAGTAGGSTEWGENCTFIGKEAGKYTTNTGTFGNVTCVGANSSATGSNQIILGDNNADTYVKGGAVKQISDIRDKADIQPLSYDPLEFIAKIQPCEYRWDQRERYQKTVELDFEQFNYRGLSEEYKKQFIEVEDPERSVKDGVRRTKFIRTEFGVKDGSKKRKRFHQGFAAQQIKAAADSMNIDFAGYQDHSINGGADIKSLAYEEFIPMLFAGIQKIMKIITKLPGASDTQEVQELKALIEKADKFRESTDEIIENTLIEMYKKTGRRRGHKRGQKGEIIPRIREDLSLEELNTEIERRYNTEYGEGNGAHLPQCPICGKKWIYEAFADVDRLHNTTTEGGFIDFDCLDCKMKHIKALSNQRINELIESHNGWIADGCDIQDELEAEIVILENELKSR